MALVVTITGDTAGAVGHATEMTVTVTSDKTIDDPDVDGIQDVVIIAEFNTPPRWETVYARLHMPDTPDEEDIGFGVNYTGVETLAGGEWVLEFTRDGGWPGGLPIIKVHASDNYAFATDPV